MELTNYLSFDGRCEEAFKFYEKVLGGKIEAMMPHEGTPAAEHVPVEWSKKIMHAHLRTGNASLMGADMPPGHYSEMKGSSVMINIEGAAEAERLFSQLADKGNVTMPLQQTFWAAKFGILRDQYGISWMLNCEKP